MYFVGAPIYGDFREPVNEQTPIAPISPYGIHQARTEERIRAHRASHLLIRVPNVVGSGGNRHQLIPSLLRQALDGAVVIQDRAERDLIGVDDVVGAVRALLVAGVVNRTVIVASGSRPPFPTSPGGSSPSLPPRPASSSSRAATHSGSASTCCAHLRHRPPNSSQPTHASSSRVLPGARRRRGIDSSAGHWPCRATRTKPESWVPPHEWGRSGPLRRLRDQAPQQP